MASSSIPRINKSLADIDVEHKAAQRPTEAQLRWAFFNRAARAQRTQNRIDRLMNFPPSVSDVDGAHSSDGDTTADEEDLPVQSTRNIYERSRLLARKSSESESESANAKAYLGIRRDGQGKWVRRHFSRTRFPRVATKSVPPSPSEKQSANPYSDQADRSESTQSTTPSRKRTKEKVNISKGRRALLRVSARAYEDRRKRQLSSPLDLESIPTTSTFQSNNSKTTQEMSVNAYNLAIETESRMGITLGDGSYFPREINIRGRKGVATAGSTALHHLQSRSSDALCIINENEERIRRFEEAYNAIILATNANFEDDEETVSTGWLNAGGKRWTRDPNSSPAISIDGRLYHDLQRAPTVSSKQMNGHKNGNINAELFDRSASWLVHIPIRSRRNLRLSVTEKNNLIANATLGNGVEEGNISFSACQKKLLDIESKIRGIENRSNLGQMQNLQAIPQASPSSPLKRQSIQPKSERSEGSRIPPSGYIRREKLAADPLKGIIGMYSKECRIQQRDDNKSKHSNIDAAPIVGTSTLRRLFARVQYETKESNHFNGSHSKNYGVTKALIHHHETDHTTLKGEGRDHKPNSTKRIHSQFAVTEGNETDVNRGFVSTNSLKNGMGCVATSSSEMNAVEIDEISRKSLELPRSKVPYAAIHEEIDEVCCRNDDVFANPIFEGRDHLHHDIFESLSDRNRRKVETLIKESLATRQLGPSIIDTDGSFSDIDIDDDQYAAKMRSMLMSPSLITKRYQQALKVIEVQDWRRLSDLINANPWLMEMKDVRNDQSFLHSLSLFGGRQNDADHDGSLEDTQPLPKQLVQNIIDYVPNVVHQLDIEGNLPMHMAAASGNIIMIRELGQRFSGAASVQNHDGLLPLHLAIMSCALFPTGSPLIGPILTLFAGAIWVKDNDGNTPLHIAAGTLRGDIGADVIDQVVNRSFYEENMTGAKDSMPLVEESSIVTFPTDILSGDPNLYLVKNKKGETPLTKAIKSLAGRQVVEALLIRDGGQLAALDTNSALQNALHLALDRNFHDAAVVLSILKSSPSAATVVDREGMLPIQLACSNSLQHEIILAIAIIDLPIDLGAKERAIMRNGFGASWWYLLCESSDKHVDIIKEILLLCSHPQKVALCLAQSGKSHDSRIADTCATPQCKLELRRSLRFFGRFEFVGGGKNHVFSRHVQKFDAIDYGTHEAPIQDGKKVSLFCYTDAEIYSRDAEHLQCSALDTELFEELSHFPVGEMEANVPSGVSLQYCVAVNRPNLKLASVVAGMPNHHKYRSDFTILGRYFGKSRSIMRQIAKALSHLHAKNIIHGLVDSSNIGKFGARWKIIGLPGSVVGGDLFATSRLGLHSPPEAYVLAHSKHSDGLSIASLAPSLKAEPTVDIWAFGKLMYEILVGESLFMIFSERDNSIHASKCIQTWNNGHLRKVSKKLWEERIGSTGVDLISSCLCPIKSARTGSMSDILQHPFWRDDNAFNLS